MVRTIASIVAGLVGWAVIVTILNFGLRAAIPGYHAAEATLQFTGAMKAGRLLEAAASSIAAGMIVAAIARDGRWQPWVVGFILLAMFLPLHVQIWTRLPIWYHLTFLLSLVPLVVLGFHVVRAGASRKDAPAL